MAEELDKKTAEDISNLRKLEAEITKELVALRERLKVLSSEDVVNLKEASTIQFQLLDLEKQRKGISKEIVDINGKVLESDERREELSQSIYDLQQDSFDRTQDMLKSTKELEKEADKIRIQQSEILNLNKTLNEIEVKILSNKENMGEKSAELLKNSTAQTKIEDYISTTLQSRKDLLDQQANMTEEERLRKLKFMKLDFATSQVLSEVEQDMIDAANEASKGSYKKLSIERELIGLKNIEFDIQEAMAKQDYEAVEFYKHQKEGLQTIIDAKMESNALNEKDAAKQAEIIEKTNQLKGVIGETRLNSVFDGVEGAVKKIPGGGVLLKSFGFDKMKDNIQQNLGNTLTSITTGFQQGGMAGFKAMIGGAKSFGMALISGPQAAIFGVLAVVGLLVAAFGDVDKSISETQKSLGGTKKEAVAAYDASAKMAKEMNMVGVNAKEVVKNVQMLSDSMGGVDLKKFMTGTDAASKGVQTMVKDATLLTEKFGLSANEVENVKTLSILSGKSMATLAGEAIQVAGGVMSSKNAMKVLSGISKEVMVSFKGSTKELISAAAKAQLLGTNLDKIKSSGMAMLDIESSLGKEMEARVLLGRDINLDAARAAALEGNIPKLQEEILKNAGSLDQFKESGPLKQKALADAMNMTVEEMTTMLTKAEEMDKLKLNEKLQNDLAEASAEKKAEIYSTQAKMLEEMGDTEAANIARQKAAEEESASLGEKMADIFAKIKEAAEKLITPLVEMVHAMFDTSNAAEGAVNGFDNIFSAIKPIFDILTAIVKVVFSRFINVLKNAYEIISPIIDAVMDIFSIFGDLSGSGGAGGFVSILETVGDVLNIITDVVGAIGKYLVKWWIAPIKGVLFGVIKPMYAIFENLMGVFNELSAALKPVFEPLFAASDEGEKAFGIMDALMIPIKALEVAFEVMGIIWKSTLILPLQFFIDLIKVAVRVFTGDFDGAATAVGDLLFNLFFGIPKMIAEAIAGAIDSIFGTNLTKSVGEFFDWIRGSFDDVGKYIMDIGAAILDYIMAPFKLIGTLIDGIVQMFSGDFMGGLETIGDGIGEFLMRPFTLISDMISAFGDLFENLGKRILNAAKGILPDWAISMLGGDTSEKEEKESSKKAVEKKSEETKKAASTEMASTMTKKTTDVAVDASAKTKEWNNTLPPPDKITDDTLMSMGKTREEYTKDYDKQIGAAAEGGVLKKGGATLVGEKGPEVVSLPQGSVVASASATKQIGSAMQTMGVGGSSDAGESPELAVLQSIDSKMGSLLEPIQKVGEMISSVVGNISSVVGSITSVASSLPGIGGIVSGISDLFGGDEENKASSNEMASKPQPVSATTVLQTAEKPTTAMSVEPAAGGQSAQSNQTKSGPDPVVEKLDRLISIMTSISSQPTIIKFGEKTVEEIQTTINLRKSYNVAVDNTYGRRV